VLHIEAVRDVKQHPFHSLVATFRRAMLDQVLGEWVRRHLLDFKHFPDNIRSERNLIEDFDFDTRILHLVQESELARQTRDDKKWLRSKRKPR
jgi:hypothetical protein